MPGLPVTVQCTWPNIGTDLYLTTITVIGSQSGAQSASFSGEDVYSHDFQFFSGEKIHQIVKVYPTNDPSEMREFIKDFIVGREYGPVRGLKVTRLDKVCLTSGYSFTINVAEGDGKIITPGQPSPYPSFGGIYSCEWVDATHTWEGSISSESDHEEDPVTELYTAIITCDGGRYTLGIVSDTWGPVGSGTAYISDVIAMNQQPDKWNTGYASIYVYGAYDQTSPFNSTP